MSWDFRFCHLGPTLLYTQRRSRGPSIFVASLPVARDPCAPQKLYPAENEPICRIPGSRAAVAGLVADREKTRSTKNTRPTDTRPAWAPRRSSSATAFRRLVWGTLPRVGRTQPFWNTQTFVVKPPTDLSGSVGAAAHWSATNCRCVTASRWWWRGARAHAPHGHPVTTDRLRSPRIRARSRRRDGGPAHLYRISDIRAWRWSTRL